MFLISHYDKMRTLVIMPVKVDDMSVDLGPCSEADIRITRLCYRCKKAIGIFCFKRSFILSWYTFSLLYSIGLFSLLNA